MKVNSRCAYSSSTVGCTLSRCRDSAAMSRALIRWPGSGIPDELRKLLFVRPSSAARSFILCTKTSSLPARCSATAIQASLAETTAMPVSSSPKVTSWPIFRNISEPPIRQARSEAITGSSQATWPFSTASSASSNVISLVMLAGGRGVPESLSKSSWPVEASISTAVPAATSNPAAGAAETVNIFSNKTSRTATVFLSTTNPPAPDLLLHFDFQQHTPGII